MTEKKKPCRVISIVNQKGGVGKSTTAINISSYLGNKGFKTLLVDLDPQSNASSGLGVYPEEIKSSTYDILINYLDPEKVILKTDYKFLDIIPSSGRLAGAEVELVPSFRREYRLKDSLDKFKDNYDFVIIDCSPALGLLTINALTASREVLVPLQCEYFALEGIAHLVKTIDLIRENLNPELRLTGVALTMYSRTRLCRQAAKEVRDYFPGKVFRTVIPRNIRLAEAPGFGKPIIAYNPECKGARAYLELTKELVSNHDTVSNGDIGPLTRRIKDFWNAGERPRHAKKE
ncbi:MAG: ParA family protein [Actinobacteria bacterium]|nr:ParA family protein [Actinomycetota bacterium]